MGYTGSIPEYTGVYWSVLRYTGSVQECTGVYSTRLYWRVQDYTGVYLFNSECSDAMLFGGHVSFSIDDENVGIWSISDPELTAIENVVVA